MGNVFQCLNTDHEPETFAQLEFKNTKITDYEIAEWPNDQYLKSRLETSKIYNPTIGLKPLKHKTFYRWYWGTWKDGIPQGNCIIFNKNQVKNLYFQGQIKGQPEGQGQIVYNEGEQQYKGQLKNGKAEGKGEYINKKQHYTFTGEWKNSKPYIGILLMQTCNPQTPQKVQKIQITLDNSCPGNKSQIQYPDGNLYLGEIDCHKYIPDGDGTLEFKNGSKYIGEFSLGEFDGDGKFIWPDGSTYEGQYSKGKRSGEGKFVFASGNYYQGGWKNGKQHGYGAVFNANGHVVQRGEWKNGVLQGIIQKRKQVNKDKTKK